MLLKYYLNSMLHHLNPLYPDMLFCVAGGHSTFFALLNTFVHIIMYFYYMVSAMGPRYQKYIWWKKYLTTFQMVNFPELFPPIKYTLQ
jgi:phosphatidylglycerophosphate synthase